MSIINAVVRRERQHIAVLEERIRAARRLRRAFVELRNAELVLMQVREQAERSLDAEDVDTLLLSWRRHVPSYG